jgi:hypothetical protein
MIDDDTGVWFGFDSTGVPNPRTGGRTMDECLERITDEVCEEGDALLVPRPATITVSLCDEAQIQARTDFERRMRQ